MPGYFHEHPGHAIYGNGLLLCYPEGEDANTNKDASSASASNVGQRVDKHYANITRNFFPVWWKYGFVLAHETLTHQILVRTVGVALA